MPEFIIDANLPYYFSVWNNERFIHLKDINDEWKDEQLWEYARNNNLIIVIKDKDFSLKVLLSSPPPKVIHIRFGNLTMKHLFNVISACCNQVEILIKTNKLANVYLTTIEAIK